LYERAESIQSWGWTRCSVGRRGRRVGSVEPEFGRAIGVSCWAILKISEEALHLHPPKGKNPLRRIALDGAPTEGRRPPFEATVTTRSLPFLLFVLANALALLLAASPARARDILHTVQKGQYLALIADRYHTTAAAIVAKNALDPKTALKPGQTLVIEETDAHRRWRVFWEKKSGKKLDERVKPDPASKKQAEAPKPTGDAKTSPEKSTPNSKKTVADVKKTADETKKGAAEEARTGNDAKKDVEAKRIEEAKKRATDASAVVDTYAREPKHPGRVTLLRWGERYVGQLVDAKGKLDAEQVKRVERLLRSFKSGDRMAIDHRLLSLLVRVSDHFGGRAIVVVSGYRPKSETRYTKDSRHNHGKAIDFRVVGVPAEVVFALCKRFDAVGCGFYPTSGFVHMDVRGQKTQWTDLAGPGEAPRYVHEIEKQKAQRSRSKSKSKPAKKQDEPAER
jgi:uncharacterized protein YcbK (DUF882 family)